jgi:hypothetical protein
MGRIEGGQGDVAGDPGGLRNRLGLARIARYVPSRGVPSCGVPSCGGIRADRPLRPVMLLVLLVGAWRE